MKIEIWKWLITRFEIWKRMMFVDLEVIDFEC